MGLLDIEHSSITVNGMRVLYFRSERSLSALNIAKLDSLCVRYSSIGESEWQAKLRNLRHSMAESHLDTFHTQFCTPPVTYKDMNGNEGLILGEFSR